ncbi:hypothetical protein ACFL1E_02630 [Candidatus Omnitrophota bacterium]
MPCKTHSEREAQYFCTSCGNYFCKDCVNQKRLGDFTASICKECGGKCEELKKGKDAKPQAFQQVSEVVTPHFWLDFFGAFGYPFKRKGRWFLFVSALLVGLLLRIVMPLLRGFIGFAPTIMVMAVVGSYLLIYLFQIIVTSAYGDQDLPNWPGINQWFDMVFGPLLLLVIATAMCYGPAYAYVLYAKDFDTIALLLLFAGGFVYPMFFLMIAVAEKLSALNPLVIIISMFKAPVEYFFTAIAFLALGSVRYVWRGAFEGIPFVGFIILEMVMFYCLMVAMRILGIFYRANEAQLVGDDADS